MPRAVTALAAALLALVGAAALALAQGGTTPPKGREADARGPIPRRPAGPLPARRDVVRPARPDGPGRGRRDFPPIPPSRLGAHDRPERLERAGPLRQQPAGHRRVVPQGLHAPLAGRRARLEAPLRVGQLPREGVAERRADRRARGRLRAVRAAHHRRSLRDGVNRLVIRVDNRRTNADIPRGYERPNGRPGGGWWNYGGILREVYLRSFESVDVESVRVRTELSDSGKRAWLRFGVRLDNPGTGGSRVRLRTTVGDRERMSRPISVAGAEEPVRLVQPARAQARDCGSRERPSSTRSASRRSTAGARSPATASTSASARSTSPTTACF